jgi:5-methyltetrahydrofolate--homocysteine methyltransferase
MVNGGSALLAAMTTRVIIADGAMGTMLQAAAPTLDDFAGHDGCNEILNVTRPDIVAAIHDAYLSVGCDAIETNTFGANWGNLAEFGIAQRIGELSRAGAAIARDVADSWSTTDHPRWVLGSVGPGTKLPTLGHAPFAQLRDAYQQQVTGMIEGGVDAVVVETAQDLLQAKAAVIGARRALSSAGVSLPLVVQVTVETTGTMLLGSEIGAALTALEPLGIDVIGLNCATGPAEMSEHLRHLSRHSRVLLSAMPNAGLPVLGTDGAHYPLSPDELADWQHSFVTDYGLSLIGGCCGTTPEHIRQLVKRVGGQHHRDPQNRDHRPGVSTARRGVIEPAAASLYQSVSFRQDTAYLSIGERTNANGSKAFREALLEEAWDRCVDIARAQIRDGAHLLDLCVDYVGRDGVADMRAVAGRFATASTLPIVLDSTEPAVIEAGLEMLGGRCVVNSVNYEDGDGPTSRIAQIMPLVREHGAAVVALTIDEEGQARTAEWKVRIADRLIKDLTEKWGMRPGDILLDALTFPIATGQEETRRDARETLEAITEIKRRHPEVHTTLGLSNVSFGLNLPARAVLNSVFLQEAIAAGLNSAIVHASTILPVARIPEDQRLAALDMIYDRRRPATDDTDAYDPLSRFLELFAGVSFAQQATTRAAELAALPLPQRLTSRIVDGMRTGLEADLDEALAEGQEPLAIVNDVLLDGMRTVGELFGRGEMQLPFVLSSAEVMKAAVAHLEPHMPRSAEGGSQSKGTIVLATVTGDVHDIGKNLVDIILTNNGYKVINLGIKQPIANILDAADTHAADVIGMSGLLVKSTVIMRENLEELNSRDLAARWPVLLGGAALTRAYVEQDLAEIYDGQVRYARDAFEGLRLMDALVAHRRGIPGPALPELRKRRVKPASSSGSQPALTDVVRSDVASDNPVPTPPFWGDRVVRGLALADMAEWIDERATFLGQWGLKPSRATNSATYEELRDSEGRPRLRMWLDRIHTGGLLEAAVTYGYFPCVSDGNDLIVLHHDGPQSGQERCRFTFPRQRRDRRLCLADFFRSRDSGDVDVVAFHIVTMGHRVSEATAELFGNNAYREYLELHGLSVQLTEALAELWHARVRSELRFADADAPTLDGMLRQEYRGSRYSFGYPACPNVDDQRQLMDLLQPERIGVVLSEESQLHPEQSTSAMIVHHPEAKYFNAT